MRKTALIFVVVLVVIVAVLWLAQRKLIYFPDQVRPPVPAGVTEVTLRTSDGLRLTAWWVPPAAAKDRDTAVLVTPGNAGHRGYRIGLANALAAEGFGVLLVDYRGYGGNPGSPSEAGLLRDVRAARDHLGDRRVVYFGESLGAAVATRLATERPPAALVLRSPFESLTAVGRHHYPVLPVGLLLRDRWPVAELLPRVDAPVTVIYGTADTVVPPAQSRTVAKHASRVVVVEGADHNDPALVDGPQVVEAITR